MFSDADRQRFWLCVPIYNNDKCWPWMGPQYPNGYGRFVVGGTRVRASRFALELKLGRKLGAGEVACHSCDNPPCCNPSHLFAGSEADNRADCIAKGRAHIPDRRGAKNARAKLSEEQVAIIRKLRGKILQRHIAKTYGISRQTVSAIQNGDRWNVSGAVGAAETPKGQTDTVKGTDI